MASPTAPTHGKLANLYRWRTGGFIGDGLNDLTIGTAAANAASAYYEVEIDGERTPDTFKWRKDGGAYTTTVAITGAAQTLDEGQTITFGATTGHTAGDEWTWGNLKDEATTEAAATAQITDSTHRILNPNAPPTWTDDGGANLLTVNFTNGTATFDNSVGNVDVDGNLGWVPTAALEKVGYLLGWSLTISLKMGDASICGNDWSTALAGQASGVGSSEALFIGGDSMIEMLQDAVDGTNEYCLLQLFNYDPDYDQTGDHFLVWATFDGLTLETNVDGVVPEKTTFKTYGMPSFTANS